MGIYEFILGIILISTVGGIISGGMRLESRRLKLKQTQAEGAGPEMKGVVGEMHAEIEKLRNRVAVLEKLVTDDDRRLADEIERLRRSDLSDARG